jgi:hypothetical protein
MHIILLTGAGLIGLPILLHLIMRQEPKKLQFPAFRFLKLRRRINQRKMRLRHFFLLLLRMILIALIALALFQPKVVSDGFNFGESPVSAVIVLDTSPTMGMILAEDRSGLSPARQAGLRLLQESEQGPWTALDDARARIMELMQELPPGSRVAILDTSDRGEPIWERSLDDARKRIREIKRPRANSQSVSRTLETAYNLMYRTDQDSEHDVMPHLLAVFSDRTTTSWDTNSLQALQGMRDRVLQAMRERQIAEPKIHSIYVDVGVEKPNNLAITDIEMKPQIIPGNIPVQFKVKLEATGTVQNNVVTCRFDSEMETTNVAVKVQPGQPSEVPFARQGLKPGLHQAEIRLQTPDRLPFDDVRYLTFRVREPRKVLLIADAPTGLGGMAGGMAMLGKVADSTVVWRVSLEATTWYSCDIRTTEEVNAWRDAKDEKLPDGEKWGQYEAIVLAGLVAPKQEFWDLLFNLVDRNGGKIIVSPGGDEMLDDPMKPPRGYDYKKLLPGVFTERIDLDRTKEGVRWTWDELNFNHPLLAHFQPWLQNSTIDFIHDKPQVWGYWEVKDYPRESVVVFYADADEDATKRRPAILEKTVGKQGGKVILFTTAMDARFDDSVGRFKRKTGSWNDYPSTSFFLVLSNLTVRCLTGEQEDATYNFPTGSTVVLKWPQDARSRSKIYYLSGPDVDEKTAVQRWDEKQNGYLRFPPERTTSAGNFTVISDPQDKTHPRWVEGFSLNPSADESNLDRLEVPSINDLFGPESVAPATKDLKLRDILSGKFDQPIELFPFLMILLLLFLAFENLLSNKFYKQPKQPVA